MERITGVKIVDPSNFRVPYAINEKDATFDIKDLVEKRKVPDEKFLCPVCEERVFFIRDTDQRSAHFRHKDTSTCDQIAEDRVKTIHDRVVRITAQMIENGVNLADICRGYKNTGQDLPTGKIYIEKNRIVNGEKYRPDLSIFPQEEEIAPTLELEVVLTHRPTKERLKLAAQNGSVVAWLNIAKLQQYFDTAKRLEMRTGQPFDFGKMCHDYVVTEKFEVLHDKDVRQKLRLFISLQREYLYAKKLEQHRQKAEERRATQHATLVSVDAPYGVSPGGRPLTWTGKVVSRQDWSQLTEWEKHGPNWTAQNDEARQ